MLSVPGLVARPFQTLFKSYKTKFESNLILASYQILHSCFLVTCITVWWSHLTVVGIPKYQARWQSVLVLDIKAVSSPDLIWCVYCFQYTTCGTETSSCWGWFFGTLYWKQYDEVWDWDKQKVGKYFSLHTRLVTEY